MKVYTEYEVKKIYADLIEQIGHDSGAECRWNGIDSLGLEEWRAAWWRNLREYGEYEQKIGAFNERARIISELTAKNNEK